jgi:hypothetical protein
MHNRNVLRNKINSVILPIASQGLAQWVINQHAIASDESFNKYLMSSGLVAETQERGGLYIILPSTCGMRHLPNVHSRPMCFPLLLPFFMCLHKQNI